MPHESSIGASYEAILDHMADGVLIATWRGPIVYSNPALSRLTGYSREQISRMGIRDLVADRKPLRAFVSLGRDGQPALCKVQIRTRKGALIPVEVHASRLPDGSALAVLRDRRVVPQACGPLEPHLVHLIGAVPNAVVMTVFRGADEVVALVNRPFAEMFRVEPDRMIGVEETELRAILMDRLETGHALPFLTGEQDRSCIRNERVVLIGPPRRVLQRYLGPVQDEHGRFLGRVRVFTDVTQPDGLEAQLRQSQKMEAIGTLAGGVAHNFNNMLTAILGNLSLLQAELVPQTEQHELAQAIEKSAMRAAGLTRALLSFARQAPFNLVELDLGELIEETAALLRDSLDARYSIVTRTTPALWSVRADPGQLQQVLLNLALNARDAMADGGTISIEAFNAPFPARSGGDRISIAVSDTGMGMTADVSDRMFDPFFTTHNPADNAGIGMSVVYGIVKAHAGTIHVDSTPGRGTRIEFSLPAVLHPTRHTPVPARKAPTGAGERVLVVDDEGSIRMLAERVLTRLGYRVILAESGIEALARFAQDPRCADLVLLDLTMPGMGGRATLAELRARGHDIPVLLSSGYTQRAGRLGSANGFIAKPYRMAELALAVREALDRGAGPPPGADADLQHSEEPEDAAA